MADEAEQASGRDDAVALAHDLSAVLEDLTSSDRTVREQAEAILDDPEVYGELLELLWDELYEFRVDRSSLVTLGLPGSLLEGRLTVRAWWEPEVEDFTVVFGRVGSHGEVLLEIKLETLEPLWLRFAGDDYETVINTVDSALRS